MVIYVVNAETEFMRLSAYLYACMHEGTNTQYAGRKDMTIE